MVSKKTVNTLLAGAVALTIAGASGSAQASGDMEGKEHCYGVVKAGHNDCGNAGKTHSCAGMASVDGGSDEWVALPEGTCEKLVGGSLEAQAGDSEEAHDVIEGENADHGAAKDGASH